MYEIIFTGNLTPEISKDTAKANIAKLFKASPAQIDAFFSGRPVIIKNQLDITTAQKYERTLLKAGLICQIVDSNTKEPWQTEQAPSQTPTTTDSSMPVTEPVDTTTAPQQVTSDDENWTLAPVGADLGQLDKTQPPPAPDVSDITLKPMEGYLVSPEEIPKPKPTAPDISNLSLSPDES
ncbi:hypothetical protein [Zooshikella harenae]|uniref:Uncharacterized protein n=1 Tax=Zooshikella harenae TaxID=2827238 RepID=A0ABS5Z7R9_9GAMM|nr:hypothetical protein [Zooshikella harenae]MBU2709803.1 hypothetical protein [Zooshikella harenae]